jgi:acyl dehydratase
MRYFEDFHVGETCTYGAYTVSKEEIIAFATIYDPQVFHIDEELAKASFVKTLIASGWHTCSLMMKLMYPAFIQNSMSYGAPGIDECKWLKPVKPGDTLTLHYEIIDKKEVRSRPQMGLLKFIYSLTNQHHEKVIEVTNWGFQGKRGAEPPFPLPDDRGRPLVTHPPEDIGVFATAFDDLYPGMKRVIGSHLFTREEILTFAHQFDPQPFHMSDAGAAKSYFGRLSASGWNTASNFMRCMVRARDASCAYAIERGQAVPEWGPAAGFKDMKWSKPVYAGDTITYFNEVIGTRPSESRPGWGLLNFSNKGLNQYGDQVFAYTGTAFIKR